MKKITYLLLAFTLVSACYQYDDTWIKEEFDDIDRRIEDLEETCRKINEEIDALNRMLDAINQNDFVTDIKNISENGVIVGYEIHFSKSGKIEIYHGKDGRDGKVPQISVKQGSDGIWYWTIDGEWMLDEQGNRISTVGREDLTPQLKIEDEYWYVSYDNGSSWTRLGKAVGEDGADGADGTSFFQDVRHDDECVYVTLADGSTITLPKESKLDVTFGVNADIPCQPGAALRISYTVMNAVSEAEILTICEGTWKASVEKTSGTEGYILIDVPSIIDGSKVVVAVSDRRKTVLKTLTFVEGVFSVSEVFSLSDAGGQFTVSVSTNYEYEVSTDAAWISYSATRAVREEELVFSYEALPEGVLTREAEITFTNSYAGTIRRIHVLQGSPVRLSATSLDMILEGEATLNATSLLGETSFLWFSSDSDIVRVDGNGHLTALTKGTAIITAMTADYRYSATCTVDVKAIDDLIQVKYYTNGALSYYNGQVQAGSELCWCIYNNSQKEILVTYAQIFDAETGKMSNKMSLGYVLEAGAYTGWYITLGQAYTSPWCIYYFEYDGKEYSMMDGSPFGR